MNVNEYLQRIGLSEQPELSRKGLQELMEAHLLHVPFENLDVVQGQPITLDVARFFDKVVERRRGGFCYELNGLFNWLLQQLGFDVTFIAATVKNKDGTYTFPNSHAANLVVLDQPYLVDVGFGDSFIRPLPLTGNAQLDPSGTYRVSEEEGKYFLERKESAWRVQYEFEALERFFPFFDEALQFNVTSSQSIFTQGVIATIRLKNGRITITDHSYTVYKRGSKTKYTISHSQQLVDLIHKHMSIPLSELEWLKTPSPH
ncbi:arylamine N-acetyltransferase [Pontibacillus halophilus JSM 076056 = DSM 19796]|uniref:Arylamine N-acetyltransferase n=1 Tax=Pontibacillus halophilus JSM 076056 = DSM 19796 TaxID=1385510 RepID=A0A0A5GKC5_9BACI|nr:arylamine N-acetyltransferase [Pontibacillus halophilus]KGX91605.1 arylamine N-acetyltransferase [Pontibacillus halophilus JSM 076056 = DSM 19796]